VVVKVNTAIQSAVAFLIHRILSPELFKMHPVDPAVLAVPLATA
jgi:hypothetical protein